MYLLDTWGIILLGMSLQVLGSSDDGLRMNSLGVNPSLGLQSSASSKIASQEIAASQYQGIRAISSQTDEINDLQHVRKDLHFPVTIDESKFTEIMHPKSQEDLEKYLPWRFLVRDIFQPKPVIVEDTNEELKRINLIPEKGIDSIREQRYWQNQIFLRYAVEEGLFKGHHEQDLTSWLEDLHKIACSGLDGSNHYYDWNERNAKFSSRDEGLMTRYQDKSPEEMKEYLDEFKQFLDLSNSSKNNVQGWLDDVAEKYVAITLHPPFDRVNNSLVMNILNLMLQKQGMHQISHGNLDQSFYDYRLFRNGRFQAAIAEFPDSIFLRAILQTNPGLENELGSLLNTPKIFAGEHKRYLEKLSKLDRSGVLSAETHHLMRYISVSDFEAKSAIFQEIINFTDLLKKGADKGVFTNELFKNCLDDISKAFDNLNLSKGSFDNQSYLLLASLGLKSRSPDFDTLVSTLEELLSNHDREIAGQNIRSYEGVRKLREEGLNFLNNNQTSECETP